MPRSKLDGEQRSRSLVFGMCEGGVKPHKVTDAAAISRSCEANPTTRILCGERRDGYTVTLSCAPDAKHQIPVTFLASLSNIYG